MSNPDPNLKTEEKARPVHTRPVFLGFGELYREVGRRPKLRLRWGRIGLASICLTVLAYLSGATFLFLFYKYERKFEEVTFVEAVVWPFQREAFRQRMGEYFIEQAKEELKEGNFLQAFHLLRNGVVRAKANLEGRQLLAEFYELGMRRPDLAASTLSQGIPYAGKDPVYLRNTLTVFMRNQMDQDIQETVASLLVAPGALPEETLEDGSLNPEYRYYQTAAFFSAQSHYYRGNYDQAEDLIKQYDLEGSRDGLFLLALINWDRGRKNTAISQLESGVRKYPETESFYVRLARFYREVGDNQAAMRTAVLRTASNPLNPIPRIELLYAYHESDNSERVISEVESLIRQYSSDERTLQLLANFAAETADINLTRRLYNHALEHGFDVSTFALLVIESQVVGKKYSQAIAFSEELTAENPDWLQPRINIFNSLRSVAYYGAGNPDLGQLYLTEFVKSEINRVDTFLAVARRLNTIGLPSVAREVLVSAWEANPENQAALSALIETEMQLNNREDLPGLVKRLLTMRRPSYDLLEAAFTTLSSDQFFFTEDRTSILIELQAILAEREVG